MVMRWRGGDRGRGREHMSLMKPVKKTPEARMWTRLSTDVSRRFVLM
jgi:hypothetical protein